MGAGAYAAGAAFFAITVGCAALVTALLLRRLPHLAGSPRWLAASVLFTFALIAVYMVPGALGVLTRLSTVATAVALAALTWLLHRRRPPAPPSVQEDAEPPGSGVAARLMAGLAAAAVAISVVAYLRTEATKAVIASDMLNFHLPLLDSWIQSGSLWSVVSLLPYDTTGNYPQNGDVVMLAAVLPWRGDAFARLAMLPYVALAGLAAYALAIELRAARAQAAALATVVLAIPIVVLAGVTSALPDVVMYGTFGAGLVFLLRCARTGLRSDALLAGLALGVAFGTKWYAVPAVVAVVALFAIGLLVARGGPRAVAADVAAVGAAVVIGGGFWLVRNAVESGSPFFPAGWIPVGARSDVGNPAPRTDFPIAHYLFDFEIWRDVILPELWRAFGVAGPLLVAGAVVAALLAMRAIMAGDRSAWLVAWALGAAAALVAVYVVTPNTASGFEGRPVLVYYSARYLVPAALPAAAATAWAATRLGRWGIVVSALAALAVADGLRRAFDLSPGRLVFGGVVLAGLVGAGLGIAHLSRVAAGARRRTAVALGAGAAAVAVAAGYALERRFYDDRLLGLDATLDYFLKQSRDGERVGLAERWSPAPPGPVHAMFGPRLRNHVEYVGERVDGVNRPHSHPRSFIRHLDRGDYDWLMIGRGSPPRDRVPALEWAEKAGYARVAESDRLVLLRRVAQP